MKILVDYPTPGEEAAVVGRSLRPPVEVRETLSLTDLETHSAAAATISADREVIAYAVSLADATRHPEVYGLGELSSLMEFGSSPRGPIGMVQAARALALLRARSYVAPEDIRDLAPDVLRHRIVLSYDALSEGVTVDSLLARILDAVPGPDAGLIRAAAGDARAF
jgi:MoxR-like ATPase